MTDVSKITIELTPYDAASILSFMREFFDEGNKDVPHFKAIHKAVDCFSKEITDNITVDQLDDMQAENQVNQLIGKSPRK